MGCGGEGERERERGRGKERERKRESTIMCIVGTSTKIIDTYMYFESQEAKVSGDQPALPKLISKQA